VYYFIYFLCISYFQLLSLNAAGFENPEELEDHQFEQQPAGNLGN
jgi:hypothetical protein